MHILKPASFVGVCQIGTCVSMNAHPQPRIIWFKDDQPLPEVKDKKESMGCSLYTVQYQIWCTGKVARQRKIMSDASHQFFLIIILKNLSKKKKSENKREVNI